MHAIHMIQSFCIPTNCWLDLELEQNISRVLQYGGAEHYHSTRRSSLNLAEAPYTIWLVG